jgi:outer membrane biosynthesis protein TonB
VSLRVTWAVLSALLALALTPLGGHAQRAQDEISRKAKSKVQAIYPELARKMNLTGTVKV